MLDPIEVFKIAASLLGGGAVGALLTVFFTVYRNRIQPVGRRVDVSPVFTASFAGSKFNPTITVSDGATEQKYQNLFVADLQFVNRGNRDLAAFKLGLTLSQGDRAVHVEPYGQDRFHTVEMPVVISPSRPSGVVDLVLKPFNRQDSYTLKVYLVAAQTEPGALHVGSSEPVRFTEMPSISEVIAKAASSAAVTVGPFTLSVR
ncbi:MAG TPA: hypothetical protein VMV72_19890 [Verrucomicrobiae bacterium]|nr:hypothetical protein [Verrucomicrobiae bacterium]